MASESRAPNWAPRGTVAARASIWAFAVVSVYQGVGIVIGGMSRWGSPGFTFLREAPGAPESWGWAIAILGIGLMAASTVKSWWLKAFCLTGITTWCLGFSVGAHMATATVPSASTTGGPAYLLLAVLAAILVLPDEAKRAT